MVKNITAPSLSPRCILEAQHCHACIHGQVQLPSCLAEALHRWHWIHMLQAASKTPGMRLPGCYFTQPTLRLGSPTLHANINGQVQVPSCLAPILADHLCSWC